MTRDEAIKTVSETYPKLVELTGRLDEAALNYRPTDQEWSVREILAHLVDDEMYVMRLRLARIVEENEPDLVPHDEKKWFATRNTARDALSELLEDFQVQRQASLGIIRFLREDEWQRRGFQPEYGHFTAEEWLGRWAAHDLNHLRQIESNLAGRRG